MKNRISGLFLSIFILWAGCSSLQHENKGVIGKEYRKSAAIANNINHLQEKGAALNDARLTSIGAWSYGVDYTLQKETNASAIVAVARELNERISALANQPDYKELQSIQKIIDNLVTNQLNSDKLLANKDREIVALHQSIRLVEQSKQQQIDKAFQQASQNAALADQLKTTLQDMDSFFGGGAIVYGFKKMIIKLAWFIGGGLLLYFLLRIAAAFNPIAATVFSIIDTIFSIGIKIIQGIAPKAAHVAGLVETRVFNDWKKTLTFVVDAIETMKAREKAGAAIKMEDLETEMKGSMNESDKARIREVQQSLLWKK